ncbi:MAG: aromatic amino acid lyase, partial [Pseudomonadota bacterium]
MRVTLTPGATRLGDLERIWREAASAHLVDTAKAAVDRSAKLLQTAAQGDAPIYGVNTGFGKLASVRISPEDAETLQRNLILSHCCGVGDVLDIDTTRLMLAIKLLSLGRGASGVR